ncbi:oxidoreductase C736.13-like protein 2 [Colletotrichum plurivorum]|uniref:Oxidoreductase C736.13-like protein 2 n=1 Tax=Colletotrichum plurivorum TaxID=2175906 RepID=A0A8H6NBB6_9PEZI|nr:oxidoreductase C736.13-like protein 2 [Colletotrichum plurivorum]
MPALFVYEKDLVNPTPQIHSLEGKVIFITGGTAGLGKSTIQTLLAHNPSHIYFSGRSRSSAEALISSLTPSFPSPNSSPPPLTFVQMDLSSLPSIKTAISKTFTHTRLDILINNAGIMASPQGLSSDGFEIQFATNHLGHAMLFRALLPILERTAAMPGSDVRVVNVTSVGYQGHPKDGISFATLGTVQSGPPVLGKWIRYGYRPPISGIYIMLTMLRQSKLANILFTTELARRYPSMTSVAVHPGVVDTGLVTNQTLLNRISVYLPNRLMGATVLTPEKGCWNQVWAAAAAPRAELASGSFYMPVGQLADDKLDGSATDEKLAGELWRWTENVLDRFE